MFSLERYEYLKRKYGKYSSWAIWDSSDPANVEIIDKCFEQLSTKYILVALNPSGELSGTPWANFRNGRHDRKLRYACNDTALRGSYITDLFKIPAADQNELNDKLTEESIGDSVNIFKQEMNDISISHGSIFVLLGQQVQIYFRRYFQDILSNAVVPHTHYSYRGRRGSDREWTEGLWRKLGIERDFDAVTKNSNAISRIIHAT